MRNSSIDIGDDDVWDEVLKVQVNRPVQVKKTKVQMKAGKAVANFRGVHLACPGLSDSDVMNR